MENTNFLELLLNPLLLTDGYKTGHHIQYPDNTNLVYSNLTARSNKYAPNNTSEVLSFAQEMTIKEIHLLFKNNFFSRPKEEVCGEMKRELSMYLNYDYDVTHFEELHDLGYLPIKVKALDEGELVPIKVPLMTIYNTHPKFYWITNYLETIISNLIWKPMVSATTAFQYRKLLTEWMKKTDIDNDEFINWQGHDFSMRGLDGIYPTISSGLGHSLSFTGSDSLPVIYGARKYYNEDGFVIGSVNATEHSVMCAGGRESEIETFRRLINIYQLGILSIVSDTWDLWKVLTDYVVELKEEILARDGKLVIRPDSGNPVDIICGDPSAETEHQRKGVVELLWDVFGGTTNEQGYKVLNPKIGAIYGDSITLKRAEDICKRLEEKGFASTNVVLGIGSFTYQYNTRDTFGFAMKATYVEVEGEGREIYKDPITDSGIKKSARGLLKVVKSDGEYKLIDRVSWDEEKTGELKTIYENGQFKRETKFSKIRERVTSKI